MRREQRWLICCLPRRALTHAFQARAPADKPETPARARGRAGPRAEPCGSAVRYPPDPPPAAPHGPAAHPSSASRRIPRSWPRGSAPGFRAPHLVAEIYFLALMFIYLPVHLLRAPTDRYELCFLLMGLFVVLGFFSLSLFYRLFFSFFSFFLPPLPPPFSLPPPPPQPFLPAAPGPARPPSAAGLGVPGLREAAGGGGQPRRGGGSGSRRGPYLPRILLTQPWLTRSCLEMSQGRTPW